MKKMHYLFLATALVAGAAMAQEAAPQPAGRGPANRPQRQNINRGDQAAARQRWGAADRGAMTRGPASSVDRIMSGGDIEGGMLLRLLDNPRIAERINLTDEQRTAITDAISDLDAQLEALRPRLDEAIKVQTALLGELKPDENRLMSAVDDAWGLRTEVAKIQTRKLLALRSKLTDEQLEQVRGMMTGPAGMRGGEGAPGMRQQRGGEGAPAAGQQRQRGERAPGMRQQRGEGGEGAAPGMRQRGGEGGQRQRGEGGQRQRGGEGGQRQRGERRAPAGNN